MTAPILLSGAWRPARALGTFTAFDPATGDPLPEDFPISSFVDVEEALGSGRRAAAELAGTPPERVAAFLDLFAERILGRADDLVEAAHRETALPREPRLRTSELPRTTGQLHQAAEAALDRSWRRATIETKLNIRSQHEPLGGPVAIFGPSNFPFAFNAAAGGDFAAALAAGNPVIAKAHPSHPATSRIFAEIALGALKEAGLPLGTLQLLYHLRPEDGLALVGHRHVGATAFTGGRPAGLRLKEAADRAGKPIYLEMSSVNPVFILSGALKERGEAIALDLFASCSLGAGQFCTKPGLVVVPESPDGRMFVEALQKAFLSPPAGYLSNRAALEGVHGSVREMVRNGATLLAGGSPVEGQGFRFDNTLLAATGRSFLQKPAELQHEAFGTVTLIILAGDLEELSAIAEALEGNLSAGLYTARDGSDDGTHERLGRILRIKAGRLLNDKMPTGLAVVPAMVHGGPFPATGHPGFTSVGFPASLLRFTALRAYDNVRPDRLPPELKDRNPTGRMWRLIDGEWTRGDVERSGT